MSRTINYGLLMHRAMRRLISEVLSEVGREGLPGDHHFFVTYDTTHPAVGMPDWLKERYPEEITIVIQHWFEDLEVEEDGFHVTLNFGDAPVPLYIPFDALQTFVDPSVEFGLRFESHSAADPELSLAPEGEEAETVEEAGMIENAEPEDADKEHEAEVVSLDKFRK